MSYINKEQAIDLIESMIADKGVAFNPHKLAMALKDMESVEIPEAKDTDTISRQAAIEALKAHEDYKGYLHGDFEEILEALPSAQPEIIRCKDCKYNLNNARLFADPDPILTYAWCNTGAFQENDFCSKGKRREE